MRIRKILVYLFSLVLLITSVYAQIDSYGIDVSLEENKECRVKMTITFSYPVQSFSFIFPTKIEELNARGLLGKVDCKVLVGEVSKVECYPQLTPEKKTIEITFRAKGLIKSLGNSYYFDGDFTLGGKIRNVFAVVRLPEGMVLSEEKPNFLPEDGTVSSDGRRIIVLWRFEDLETNLPLKFRVVYEKLETQTTLQLWQIGVIVGVISVASGYLLIQRFLRIPKEIILSVLDDYEKKVLNVIFESGGKVKQKKIVEETKLSKAKVSRVLKDLKERGLVEIERLGRTNLIKLVKKKFE